MCSVLVEKVRAFQTLVYWTRRPPSLAAGSAETPIRDHAAASAFLFPQTGGSWARCASQFFLTLTLPLSAATHWSPLGSLELQRLSLCVKTSDCFFP